MLKAKSSLWSHRWQCRLTAISWIGLVCFPLIAAEDTASTALHLRAHSGVELDNVIAKHIRNAEVAELCDRKTGTDRSLALAAAWEIARRIITKGGGETTARKIALGRFVGFVEGRLGVDIPEFWERSILNAEVTHQGLPHFRQADGSIPYREFKTVEGASGAGAPRVNMISPKEANVILDGEEFHFILGRERLELPGEFGKSFGYPYNRICVLMTNENAYVALHPVSGYGYSLVCISRKKETTRWTCQVWGYGEFFTNGDECHWVALVETDDELLVFGMSDYNAYIQGFRKADGANTLRFGTVYGVNWYGPRTKK